MRSSKKSKDESKVISQLRKVYSIDGNWYVLGSSEVFNSREEAVKRLISQKIKKNKKRTDGRRFISHELQMSFRSTWEIELAELMTELGITWVYEPERFFFRREKESYLPDFYLPDYNVWIEVKGWMDERSLKRVKLFKRYHGKETGFFLYEKEERKMVLEKPELLFTLIEVAKKELERSQGNDSV